MLYHLVLFKVKPNSTEEQLVNFLTGVRSLSIVPGVVSVQIEEVEKAAYLGYDDRSKGYTHALLVLLKDKKALKGYDSDSYHLLVKSTIIKPMLDMSLNDPVLAIDWEGSAPNMSSIFSIRNLFTLTNCSILFAVLALSGFAAFKARSRL